MRKKKANDIFDVELTVKNLVKEEKIHKSVKPRKEKNIQKLAITFIDNPTEKNFANLVERITWGLRSHIYKIVNDDEVTTEVLSKTLENIYFKRDQFNPNIAKFSTWMYRIAFNNALKWRQAKNAKSCLNIDFEDLYDNTISEKDDKSPIQSFTSEDNSVEYIFKNGKYENYDKERILTEFYDASVKSISKLPDNLRVVMSDRLLNTKKIEDIAYDNNIPLSSVKNWLRKGKSELQNIIKHNYPTLYDMYMEVI